MGAPMAANLVKAGHTVQGFDLVELAKTAAAATGVHIAPSAREAVAAADVVVTMLPAGKHVLALCRTFSPPRSRAPSSSIAPPSTLTAPSAPMRPARAAGA